MGDQLFGDLSNAFRNVTVSRKRALQIIGGAIAVAAPERVSRSAEARKRRKPPLAFVAATVTINAAFPTMFRWQVTGAVAHPGSNYATTFLFNQDVASEATTDKVRADIVARLKIVAEGMLKNQGPIVPKDRIAVTLL
jgi:hypothetical protein